MEVSGSIKIQQIFLNLQIQRIFTQDYFDLLMCFRYTSLDPSSCIYIDQLSQLQRLLETLKNEKEVAVDLEHHSYRSFQGITCLMQVWNGLGMN